MMTNTGATPTVPTKAESEKKYPETSPYGLVGWP
jgi:hypothetical protein